MTSIFMIVGSTLGLPAADFGIFWLRFHRMPPDGTASVLVFMPIGLAAGVIAAFLISQAKTRRHRRFILFGYLIASPFVLVAVPLGGLLFAGTWGAMIAGVIPLALGCLVGDLIGNPRTLARASD